MFAIAYSSRYSAVLITVVRDGDTVRIIPFRHACEEEREVYHDGLEHNSEND